VTYLERIASLSRKHRLPAAFDAREYVEAGGLMSNGPNIDGTYRQLASYAYKLLHGTPPSELPIEQPTTFELVINKRTADSIGALQRAREAYEHDLTTAWRRGAGKQDVAPDALNASGNNEMMPVDDIEIVYRLYLEEIAKV
jgi:hypothetical protein